MEDSATPRREDFEKLQHRLLRCVLTVVLTWENIIATFANFNDTDKGSSIARNVGFVVNLRDNHLCVENLMKSQCPYCPVCCEVPQLCIVDTRCIWNAFMKGRSKSVVILLSNTVVLSAPKTLLYMSEHWRYLGQELNYACRSHG
ncbi:hypothetical protein O6P43_010721 [Quillaja saponaria]|uniref:Uncharacterized protein n=1 Tax=Quillaja saponaria TaxID=32244 RepID=A0AAD7Q136_QUISA|nr:hypothetical protein O6P43_010721 [Quillaja saponaria]